MTLDNGILRVRLDPTGHLTSLLLVDSGRYQPLTALSHCLASGSQTAGPIVPDHGSPPEALGQDPLTAEGRLG